MVGKDAGWAKKVGEGALRLRRLKIGRRLTLCFLLIILVLLIGNAVLIWEFHEARVQADRLTGVDEELVTVLQGHTSLMSFYERLDALAHSENTAGLVNEVEALHTALLQDSARTKNALSQLPREVQPDPALLPTLLTIQGSLPAELDAIAVLAKSKDWGAVRLRLANQIRPLESRSSALVANVDREVGEERRQAIMNIERVQKRILSIVPITGVLTLLFAAFLGLAITHSITQPLGRLMEGSAALARGDFSHRVPAVGNDEIANLGRVFNEMVVRLQELYSQIQRRESYLAEAQNLSQTGSFGWDVASGEIFWSDETFRIFEFDPKTRVTIQGIIERTHPEDRARLQEVMEKASRGRTEVDMEHRLLMADDSVKYLRVVGRPVTNDDSRIEFVGAVTDITARKQAEVALRRSSEELIAERAQLDELFEQAPEGIVLLDVEDRVLRTNPEFTRIFGYTPEEAIGRSINDLIAPEELRREADEYTDRLTHGERVYAETIRRRKDGRRVHVSLLAVPISVPGGQIAEYAIYRDITERKMVEGELTKQRAHLNELFETVPEAIAMVDLRDAIVRVNPEFSRIFGYSREEAIGRTLNELVAPGELRREAEEFTKQVTVRGEILNVETVRGRKDGSRFPVSIIGVPISIAGSQVGEYAIYRDITERKRAEQELRRSQRYLAEAERMSRSGSWAWNVRTDEVFWSEEMFRIFGYEPEETKPTMPLFLERVHPEDRPMLEERARRESTETQIGGSEGDFRIVLPDGTIKQLHSIAHPVADDSGAIIEVVGTTMDISEQHEARKALETAFAQIQLLKEQLYKENIALREEIDRSSMFEEIVGESPALQGVLARVAKVAPTDSTVLISGETGTGKELIARAIHKRSNRAPRAFVSVNCAAIPASLIASELFGHEKGAFTGAVQRRLGRFELAEGGTIFLDEIGELPAETQIALLRVLQEREFERVGGTKVIRADVRVIAASNRDLPAAIAAGTFRSDLYYRLNVFPIEVPPLRKRREDIPLLVEYFIDRYGKKAGKKIRAISGATLERLKLYAWPGNVRELQNVVERSVILCESETLTIEEGRLLGDVSVESQAERPLFRMPADEEKKAIEAALADAHGRVSGPDGAAAKLGIPPSTLDSKIRALGINKYRFKAV